MTLPKHQSASIKQPAVNRPQWLELLIGADCSLSYGVVINEHLSSIDHHSLTFTIIFRPIKKQQNQIYNETTCTKQIFIICRFLPLDEAIASRAVLLSRPSKRSWDQDQDFYKLSRDQEDFYQRSRDQDHRPVCHRLVVIWRGSFLGPPIWGGGLRS